MPNRKAGKESHQPSGAATPPKGTAKPAEEAPPPRFVWVTHGAKKVPESRSGESRAED